MAPFRYVLTASVLLIGVFLFGGAAKAITADEVMKKMSKEERFSYLTGLIDMLAFQTASAGNGAKASCVINAYYRDGKDESWKNLYDALGAFGDRQPAIVLTLLVRKACGN